MDIADTFMPTAGTVGLLPMVTYFFLVVAIFSFLSNFVFALSTQAGLRTEHRITHALTAVISAAIGLTYYLIWSHYHDALAELATVTDVSDRQTLIRESYNAIGQYRYINWFVIAPLLLIQIVFRLNLRLSNMKRLLAALLMAASFMFFASYIGHQQLSFDNEIEVGMKVTWGLLATIDYVSILFALSRFWKQFGEQANPDNQHAFRLMSLITIIAWGVYLVGYFLTVTVIDFTWIHLIFTLTDIITIISVGIVIYFASMKSVE